MRRLIAIELKMGRFMPADMGQMEFYLRWLKQNEKRPGEADPLGIVLCADAAASASKSSNSPAAASTLPSTSPPSSRANSWKSASRRPWN